MSKSIGSAALLLVLAACSGDGGVAPVNAPTEDDAARAVAAGLSQGLALMRLAEGAFSGTTAPPAGVSADPQLGGCSYSLAAQQWTCTATNGGASGSVVIQFRNGAGQPTPGYSDTETASVRVQSSLQGSFAGPGASGSGTTTQDYTVSGLAGAETQRTWNGTGSSTAALAIGSGAGAKDYTLASTSQVQALVFRLPRESNPWPASGTVSYSATLAHAGASVTWTVVVTFSGGSQAALAVNGHSFRVDLATGAVTRV